MDHREIERWYRLRNLKKASQFLMIAAVLVLLSGYGVSRFLVQRPADFSPPATAVQGIRVDRFSYSSPGAHPWELQASTALVSDTLDRVVLKNPRVTYGGEGSNDIVLTANSGELDRKRRNLSAEGDVTIRYKDFLFKAGDIEYSQENLVAQTSSPVSLRGDSLLLTGRGLKLLVKKKEVLIEQDVKAVLFKVKWVEPGRKLPM